MATKKKLCSNCPAQVAPDFKEHDRVVALITMTACTYADALGGMRSMLPVDYRWLCMTTIARARELGIDIENILDVVFPAPIA